MNYAFKEIEMAKRLDWIDSIFTNDQEEDFIKKATVHLLFETYDLQKWELINLNVWIEMKLKEWLKLIKKLLQLK